MGSRVDDADWPPAPDKESLEERLLARIAVLEQRLQALEGPSSSRSCNEVLRRLVMNAAENGNQDS